MRQPDLQGNMRTMSTGSSRVGKSSFVFEVWLYIVYGSSGFWSCFGKVKARSTNSTKPKSCILPRGGNMISRIGQ